MKYNYEILLDNNVLQSIVSKKRYELNSKVVVSIEDKEYIAIIKGILKPNNDLKNIIVRKATKKDLIQQQKNIEDAKKAKQKADNLIKQYGLAMKILSATYSLDRKQLLFSFTAEGRIDFRELAKSLAGIYRTRIELRQIGIRDKAKEVGGIGQCGRCLCCSSFLNNIGSISMNMVKNQNIAINPSKINGQCGRLLCCLTYEDEAYTQCQKYLPKVGQIVKYEDSEGKVTSVDVLNLTYFVEIDGNIKEVKVDCENCLK